MEKQYWHDKWDSNEIGFHQDAAHPLLDSNFPSLELPKSSHVFVPLCGKSPDMLRLRDMGYRVSGLELSKVAVTAFFSENRLEYDTELEQDYERYTTEDLQVLCGDYFRLDARVLGQIDSVFDRASLVAMPPKMRSAYINILRTLMVSGGKILLIVLEYDQDEISPPPFSIKKEEVIHLYSDWCHVELLETIDSEVKGRACKETAYRLTVN